jgi:hypothetical protein
MSDFSERARKIQQSIDTMLETVRAEAAPLLEQMDDADLRFDEQSTLIASLQATNKMQAEEIDRLSADYQDKIDRRDAEIAALRSRLNQKDKNFSVLSRAIPGMMNSARHVAALGAHAMNLIGQDAAGDRIVTQLRGHPPQRRAEPTIDGQRVDGDPYAPRQRMTR